MKTSFACLALIAAMISLIVVDAHFPHVLSPQTYCLLLLTCIISLLIHAGRLRTEAKSHHRHAG